MEYGTHIVVIHSVEMRRVIEDCLSILRHRSLSVRRKVDISKSKN